MPPWGIPHRRRHAWKLKLWKLLVAIGMEVAIALLGLAFLGLLLWQAHAHGQANWIQENPNCERAPEGAVLPARWECGTELEMQRIKNALTKLGHSPTVFKRRLDENGRTVSRAQMP